MQTASDNFTTAIDQSIKKMNMTWPQMSDLKFWQSEGAQLYAVNSIPHTVLIDGSGKIFHAAPSWSRDTPTISKFLPLYLA